MADETQHAPVAGAEKTATQENKNLFTYYYSDPDGATKVERCSPNLHSEIPFTVLPWHVHKEAPAAGMVDPVWNDQLKRRSWWLARKQWRSSITNFGASARKAWSD